MLDKTTGRVWEYDKAGRAFVFVPMKPAPEHEQIAGILLERDLVRITDKYTEEVLGTLPARVRATQRATFEKTYIEPRAPRSGIGRAARIPEPRKDARRESETA